MLTRLASGLRTRDAGTSGVRAPIVATQNLQYTGKGLPQVPNWDARSAVEQGYLGHPAVYAAVRTIADTCAALPFRAGPDPNKPGEFNHDAPLARLLGPAPGGPNPTASSRALWAWSIAQRIVTGRMGWELERAPRSKQIVNVWPLVSQYLQPIPTVALPGQAKPTTYFAGYRYNLPDGFVDLPYNSVFYSWRMSQSDPRQAETVMQAARIPISIALALNRYHWGMLNNGMAGRKLVITPPFEEADQRRAWQEQFLAEMTGFDNAGKPAFGEATGSVDPSTGKTMPPSIQVIDLAQTSTDAELMALMEYMERAIYKAFAVPESEIGDASNRTFSNASEEYRVFWTRTIVPLLAEIADDINTYLAPQLGNEVGWFDLSGVEALRPAKLFAQITPDNAEKAGLIVPGEWRQDVGLPWDIPQDAAAPPEPETVAEVDDPAIAPGGSSSSSSSRAAQDSGPVDASKVRDYLAKSYPPSVLGWVTGDGVKWMYEPAVRLTDIDMARRPGGRDQVKVEKIADAVTAGDPMEPIVLVDTGDDAGLQIADGYHRTLAFQRAGRRTIAAYVASGAGSSGPWDKAMHDAKLNRAPAVVDVRHSVIDRIDAMVQARHAAAGARVDEGAVGDYKARHLIEWFNAGAGGKIDWGGPNDLTICHQIASMHMDPDKAWGFCQNRHEDVLGKPNSPKDDRSAPVETESGSAGLLLPKGPVVKPKPRQAHVFRPSKGDRRKCAACSKSVTAAGHLHTARQLIPAVKTDKAVVTAVRHRGPHLPVVGGHANTPERARQAVRKTIDRHVTAVESQMTDVLKKLFTDQGKATVSRMSGNRGRQMIKAALRAVNDQPAHEPTPSIDPTHIFDQQFWTDRTIQDIRSIMSGISSWVPGHFATHTPGVADVEDDTAAVQSVQDLLAQATNRIAGQITQETFTQLTKALTDGVIAGDGYSGLATRVQQVFDDASRTRAETIARTEVHAATMASQDQYAANLPAGVISDRAWLATEDSRTRPAHAAAEGQKRPLGQPFNVGDAELMFPGDPAGPPESVINCRCVLIYLPA